MTGLHGLHELCRAAAHGATPPLVSDRRAVRTLADVLGSAQTLGADIAARASRDRAVVVARVPPSVAAVELLLAAVANDLTICFVDPSGTPERFETIAAALDPDVLVDGDTVIDRRPATDGPEEAGYVAMSSGSTGGPPKGVLSTWTCLAAFAPHGAEALRLGAGDRLAEPSHPSYDLAITNWLLALTSGASLSVSGALADRMRPLAFATRAEASHVRLAPRFIDLARAERDRSTAPHPLRVWASGGDRLSQDQAEGVFDLGVATLVNTYGTSETAGFASAAAFDSAGSVTSRHRSVSIGAGRVGPWHTVLVDEVQDGRVTEMLAIGSPHLRAGYLVGGPARGADGEAVYPRWEQDRVLTGDLGCRVGTDLVCLGRSGRLVKRNGVFVNLDDVDRVLRTTEGVDAVTVMVRSGELVTLVSTGRPDPVDWRQLEDALADRVTPDLRPDVLVPIGEVPRLANGKTHHAEALRLAELLPGLG